MSKFLPFLWEIIKNFPKIIAWIEKLIDSYYTSMDKRLEGKLKEVAAQREDIIIVIQEAKISKELSKEEKDEIYKNQLRKLYNLRFDRM